jgi:geranylgeranyl diphosphate synthase, type II
VGSRGTAELEPLIRFGFHFGAAFQIRDDLLNLVGDQFLYGKEILGDLYEGKRTLPLVHLSANASGDDADIVRDYLRRSRESRTADHVQTIRELMDRYHSIQFATEFA